MTKGYYTHKVVETYPDKKTVDHYFDSKEAADCGTAYLSKFNPVRAYKVEPIKLTDVKVAELWSVCVTVVGAGVFWEFVDNKHEANKIAAIHLRELPGNLVVINQIILP